MHGTDKIFLLDLFPRCARDIFSAEDSRRLEALGRVIWYDGEPAPDSHIDRHLPDAVALIGQSPMPRQRLDRAPHLRLIVNVEGNFQATIDHEECYRRNIYVTSIAPVFAVPVAEMVLGMALAVGRGIVEGDVKVREGCESLYGATDMANSFLLRGKTMGIIGCGNLGRELIPMLRPFRGEILVHDPWIHDQVLRDLQVQPVRLKNSFADRGLSLFWRRPPPRMPDRLTSDISASCSGDQLSCLPAAPG